MFFDMPALDDFPTAFQGCVHNFRVGINKLVFDEHLTDGIVDELVDGQVNFQYSGGVDEDLIGAFDMEWTE